MKRVILLISILTAALAVLPAAGERDTAERTDGKITVATTNFPAYDFVRQIAKDMVNIAMLLPPGAESHSYEPSPRNMITIRNSDIFIHIGSEYWVDRIFKSMNTDSMKILSMMNAVELVMEETTEGMEGGSSHGPGHYDEHVWTSPQNAILIVRAITELLCTVNTDNADFFRQNSASYITELEKLDAAFKEVAANSRRKVIVFGDRFPFRYLADAYGLEYFAAFPGCSTQTDASAATVAFLINKIRTERIPIVFHIELSNERMANTISTETGARKLLLHACHNVSKRDFDSGLGYLDFMRNNVENLRQALY